MILTRKHKNEFLSTFEMTQLLGLLQNDQLQSKNFFL